MEKVRWYNINTQGYIIDNHNNVIIKDLHNNIACIYAYKFKQDDKNKFYIGSTINLYDRIRRHKCVARLYIDKNYTKYKKSIFYSFVNKYGWERFQFGIIEYINYKSTEDKQILLNAEQKYFDLLHPELNIQKTAGSNLGYKHTENTKLMLSLIKRGKNLIKRFKSPIVRQNVSNNSILKMKLHRKGIIIKFYDKNWTLIKEFDRTKEAADFLKVSGKTIYNYINNGRLLDNLYYIKQETKFKTEDITNNFPLDNINSICYTSNKISEHYKSRKVEVLHNNVIIYRFNTLTEAELHLNVSRRSIIKYCKNNKLWKDKYRFEVYSSNKIDVI